MKKLVLRATTACLVGTTVAAGMTMAAGADDGNLVLPSAGAGNTTADENTAALQDARVPEKTAEAVETADTAAEPEAAKEESLAGSQAIAALAEDLEYVNIRAAADDMAESIGKMYDRDVATVLGEEGIFYYVTSGSVTGYVHKDCVFVGEEAENYTDLYYTAKGTNTLEGLHVRTAPDDMAEALCQLSSGEVVDVLENDGGWSKIYYADGDLEGYVHSDCLLSGIDYSYAESNEEEAIRLAEEAEAAASAAEAEEAAREAEEAAQAAEAAAKAAAEEAEAAQKAEEEAAREEAERAEAEAEAAREAAERAEAEAETRAAEEAEEEDEDADAGEEDEAEAEEESYNSAESYSDSSKGQQIANYALQFVGNPYVWGGTSLTNGADCSGFVMSVMADCGISVAGRTAAAQSQGGVSVSSDNLQPGDLIFYTHGGSVGHVAIYIGDGRIVHAANSRRGITTDSAFYQTPYKCVRYY